MDSVEGTESPIPGRPSVLPTRPKVFPDLALTNPRFSVIFHKTRYNVDRIMQERPIAVVLAVSNGSKRLVIKIYPKRDRSFHQTGFINELRAYKLFRDKRCQVVPAFLGSTQSLIAEYPENTNIPPNRRFHGKQRAIRLEYLDGVMLLPSNATEDAMAKALRNMDEIHKLSVYHGDVYYFGCWFSTPRNVMLLTNGDVKWIDFEHSIIGADAEDLQEEQDLITALIGPKGLLWRRRQGLPDYPSQLQVSGDNDGAVDTLRDAL